MVDFWTTETILGVGRRTRAQVGGGVSTNRSNSKSSSEEWDFQYKLDFATLENSCIQYEYDSNEPVNTINGVDIYG